MNDEENREESLEAELRLGQEELEKELAKGKPKKREDKPRKEDTLILLLKDLVNQKHPAKFVAAAYQALAGFNQTLKVVVLDAEYNIYYMTNAAKKVMGFSHDEELISPVTKDIKIELGLDPEADIPLIGQPYTSLIAYGSELERFTKALEERRRITQDLVIDHKFGRRVHLKSTILDYITTAKGNLIAIPIGWSNNRIPSQR